MMEEIVLPHGNYRELESYRGSVVIFDATADFCTRFLKPGDRTVDQMVQAAGAESRISWKGAWPPAPAPGPRSN
jgi:hypothetical protein